MQRKSGFVLALPVLALIALTGCTRKKEIWIYTSIYKEVIAEMSPALKKAVPNVEVKWFQAGSENVASKVNAELAAGRTRADLILTSDPFWYLELKKAGRLLEYESPAAAAVDARFRDPDHAFVNVRMPVMVLAYNPEAVDEKSAPKSFKELQDSKWKGKLSMGSPLESGTMFTTVALLAKKYGWSYFENLRKLDLIAAGGNSSVITRVETKERPVGIVLLENVLKAQGRGSHIRAIYPADGAVPVPSPIAIFKSTEDPVTAKKIYDWFFSDEAQRMIAHGGMYPANPAIDAPKDARTWAELSQALQPWSPAVLEEIFSARESIKQKFAETVLH